LSHSHETYCLTCRTVSQDVSYTVLVNTPVNDDPRVSRSRDAILQAVAAILAEDGPGGITHQRVAERAGVGRATVYRHWPQPVDLLAEVIEGFPIPFLEEPGDTLRGRLQVAMRRLADDLSVPIMRAVVSSLVEQSQHDEATRSLRDAKIDVVRQRIRQAVADALATGELTGEPDPDELVSRLVGPMFFRILLEHRPVSDRFIDELIDDTLARFTPQS